MKFRMFFQACWRLYSTFNFVSISSMKQFAVLILHVSYIAF